MRSTTHNLFSVGLILYVVSYFGYPLLITVLLMVVATVFTNFLIDKVGHTRREGVPRRTWVTHSVVTAPLWGAAAWALTIIVPAALVGVFPPGPVLVALFAGLGAFAGWSHLFLDSLTEGGVFAPGGKRWALAHFSYDNRSLNLGLSALGLTLLLVALF
ncbi:MAG: DUF1286 domain-containing protein [Thaumarchaeota archaeon]|nr:DUF1286 domain-containing protein [Nitrososphaerota archaeon]